MLAPSKEAYHEVAEPPQPELRCIGRRSVIDEAKEKVPVIDLADLLCGAEQMRRVGNRWVARCPLPGHEDRSPSFTVFLETNSWHCFGACGRGGDVVDLAAAAWGYGGGEMAMAAADLLDEYGHEIPERPASWFAKQERQRPIREAMDAAILHVARRRLYRRFFETLVLATKDTEDREHDARLFWEATLEPARMLVEGMRDQG